MLQTQTSLALGLIIASILGLCNCRPVGFSYAKFSGPVSGPEKEVYVKDQHGRSYVDYIQKPDYSFAYGVDDPKTRVLQNRKESRHGDAVKGEYSVVDPDGTLRVVKYTADKKNGFQAEVITDGKSQIHGHDLGPNIQQHQTQYHPPPPPPSQSHHHQQQYPSQQPTQHHEQPYQEHDYYDHHHEEPETNYHQNNNDAPQTAAYTSHTRHPPANTQYHQGGYLGEAEDDDGSENSGSAEHDEEDDDDESGEDDDEEQEEEEEDY